MSYATNPTSKRKQIGKKVRFDIFKRDGFLCQYCGNSPPSVLLQVDHIISVKNGGDNSHGNLVTSCQPCNIGKGATSLSVIPKSLKEKSKETEEKELQIQGYNDVMMKARNRVESDCWTVANHYLSAIGKEQNKIDTKIFNSIKVFVEKSGLIDCLEAMDLSITKWAYCKPDRIFLYFCGVMWKKIKEGSV